MLFYRQQRSWLQLTDKVIDIYYWSFTTTVDLAIIALIPCKKQSSGNSEEKKKKNHTQKTKQCKSALPLS